MQTRVFSLQNPQYLETKPKGKEIVKQGLDGQRTSQFQIANRSLQCCVWHLQRGIGVGVKGVSGRDAKEKAMQ